jgi:stage V sporulation protein G
MPKQKRNAEMQVTEVEVVFVKPKDGLIAFASVVLDDRLYLSGIAIHRKLVGDGYRLTYHTRKIGNSQFSLFHPIRKEICRSIEDEVFAKLKDVVSGTDAGHDRLDAGSASV